MTEDTQLQTADSRRTDAVRPRLIVALAFDQVTLFNIAAPLEAFAAVRVQPRWGTQPPHYEIAVVAPQGVTIQSWSGIRVNTDPLPDVADIDTLIVPGAMQIESIIQNKAVLAWIGRQAPRARRLCGLGAGVFVLAAAGVIPGKRVVTHWYWTQRLRSSFPDLKVEPDIVFLRDGNLWTGGGMAASVDVALNMIEEDLGHAYALDVARAMVIVMKRAGGQSQISSGLKLQAADDGRFSALHDWLQDNLATELKVEQLAARVGMSERGFARAFVKRVGVTPAKAVEAMRLEAAQRALEQTQLSVKQIARDCGFGDEERLRRAFVRTLGIQPMDYRRSRQ